MSQVMGTLSSLVNSILVHPSLSCRRQVKVWTALQAGRELAACRSVGQQGRGRTGDRLHGAPGWKGLGHRYVDMTVGRKVSSLWAPCPLGGQPLLHAHLQARVEDEGAVVQFTARDVSPKASWLSVSENVS